MTCGWWCREDGKISPASGLPPSDQGGHRWRSCWNPGTIVSALRQSLRYGHVLAGVAGACRLLEGGAICSKVTRMSGRRLACAVLEQANVTVFVEAALRCHARMR